MIPQLSPNFIYILAPRCFTQVAECQAPPHPYSMTENNELKTRSSAAAVGAQPPVYNYAYAM